MGARCNGSRGVRVRVRVGVLVVIPFPAAPISNPARHWHPVLGCQLCTAGSPQTKGRSRSLLRTTNPALRIYRVRVECSERVRVCVEVRV